MKGHYLCRKKQIKFTVTHTDGAVNIHIATTATCIKPCYVNQGKIEATFAANIHTEYT